MEAAKVSLHPVRHPHHTTTSLIDSMLKRIATRASSSRVACRSINSPLCLAARPQHEPPSAAHPTLPSSTRLISSSSSLNKQFQPRRRGTPPRRGSSNRKSLPAWKQREQTLRLELSDLERKLDRIDKRQRAEEATRDLPELDDEALEEVYKGLEAPEKLSGEEVRLLGSAERKALERRSRVLRLVRGGEMKGLEGPAVKGRLAAGEESKIYDLGAAEETSEPAPTTFFERVQLRLDRLAARLTDVEAQLHQEGKPSTSQAGEIISEIKEDVDAMRFKAHTLQSEQKEAQEQQEEAEGAEEPEPFETIRFDEKHHVAEAQETAVDTAQEATAPSVIVEKLERLVSLAEPTQQHGAAPSDPLITSIQPRDWVALGTSLAHRGEQESLGKTFGLLTSLSEQGKVDSTTLVSFHESVADAIAERGDSRRCEAILGRMEELGLAATPYAYHALAKAYLRDPAKGLSSALALLDHIENLPAPDKSSPPPPAALQATYSLVLSSLLDDPNIEVRDEAWGLWYRMRLNAHPVPDAVVWSNMLRACALGSTPARHAELGMMEGHRGMNKSSSNNASTPLNVKAKAAGQAEANVAMDLFREMTVTHGVRPTPSCYDHLILALCRGPKGRYLEGFRLLSERISLARNSVGTATATPSATATASAFAAYEPTRPTFNALLEGCKRHADVLRARWVLAEMIRSSAGLWGTPVEERVERLNWRQRVKMEMRMPDAESLGKVFLTYAAWTPSVGEVPRKKAADGKGESKSNEAATAAKASDSDGEATTAVQDSSSPSPQQPAALQPAMDEAASEFSSTPPATSADVVRELRGLLARAIADQPSAASQQDAPAFPSGPLSCVTISTRLLNSYLMALAAHTPRGQRAEVLSAALRGDESLFARLGLQPNGRTYLLTLQACFTSLSASASSNDRVDALAEWAWAGWRRLEEGAEQQQQQQQGEATTAMSTASTAQSLKGAGAEVISPTSLAFAKSLGLDRRTRELIWAERIRYLSKASRLTSAMTTLREFAQLYPPSPRPKDLGLEKEAPVVTALPVGKDGTQRTGVREKRRRPFFDFEAVRSGVGRVEERRREAAARMLGGTQLMEKAGQALLDEPAAAGHGAAATAVSSPPTPTPAPTLPPTQRRRPSGPVQWLDAYGRPTRQPPSLSFYELNLLHQRLIEATDRPTRENDIAYIGYLCRTWESVERGTRRRGKGKSVVGKVGQSKGKEGGARGVEKEEDGEEYEEEEQADWFGDDMDAPSPDQTQARRRATA